MKPSEIKRSRGFFNFVRTTFRTTIVNSRSTIHLQEISSRCIIFQCGTTLQICNILIHIISCWENKYISNKINFNSMEKFINRFDKYMKYKGLNDNKVTVELGISVGLIGKCRKEFRDMSRALVSDVLNYYKDLSPEWLMTGSGNMLITPDNEVNETISKKKEIKHELPQTKSIEAIELENLKKLYEMQKELLREIRKDRDRLAGLIEEKQLKES